MNWAKVAALLSSNLFFLASCSGITFLSAQSLPHVGGSQMSRGGVPDPRMMVIASIPDPEAPGQRKLTQVMLASLSRFQSSQPDHSFIIPTGEGEVRDVSADMITSYRVMPLSAGRVEVRTDFSHDVPPLGLNIVARYEATEREVKPLYTNASTPMGALFLGIVGALVLATIGSVMRWMQRRRPGAADRSEESR